MWVFSVSFLDYINRDTATTGVEVAGRDEAFALLDEWMVDKLVDCLIIDHHKKKKQEHRVLTYSRLPDGDWEYTDVMLKPGDFGYGRYDTKGLTSRKPGGGLSSGTQGSAGAAPGRRVRSVPVGRRTASIPVGR